MPFLISTNTLHMVHLQKHSQADPLHLIAPSSTGHGEHQPLLGNPSAEDVVMDENRSLAYNWIQGTAPLAQVGGLVLFIVVWASVFTHKLIIFDGHPVGLLAARCKYRR